MNKLYLLFLLIIPCGSFAQISGLKDFKWRDKPVYTDVYSKFSDEDAYLIYEKKSISIELDSRGLYLYNSIRRKIKILTQTGLDNYARIVLPKSAGRKLTLADARTIKKDGKVIDLDVKNIKQLEIADDDELFNSKNYLIFAIPGVEVGDDIEIIAGYGGYGMSLGQDIYLHSYLPAESSEVTIKRMKSIELDVRFYNKLEYPLVNENATHVTFQWNSKDLPSLENQAGSVPTLDLPFISYAVKKINLGASYYDIDGVGDNWNSISDWIGKQYLVQASQRQLDDRKINEFLQEIWKKDGATDIYSKMKSAHQFFNNYFTVVNLPEKKESLPLYAYIESREVDESNLFRIYHYLLENVTSEYFFCLCRNFYDGPIDMEFVAYQQITDILYRFNDESGKAHYLVPKSRNRKYEIDEVPSDIQGTKYVSIELSKKKQVSFPTLPFNQVSENVRSRMAKVEIEPGKENVGMDVNETLMGVYSTMSRHYYLENEKDSSLKKEFVDLMKERNSNVTVDSVSVVSYEHTFPFPLKLHYGYKVNKTVSKMDEKLYSINIEDWFYHQVDKIKPEKRIMDYYFPYLGRDEFKYYLVFPSDVELVNSAKLTKNVVYPFCTYRLNVTQASSNTILVESSFESKRIKVPVDEMKKFADLQDQMEEADNEQVIVKIL